MRAQRGDHEAFDLLATEAFDRLYAIAARILRDADRADDAVQDALVRAWRDLRGLREPERFDAWLHRLLVHACYDAARQRQRRRIEVQVLDLERAAEGDHAAHLADRDQIERAFHRLTPEHRAVLVLKFYLGLTANQIAETLAIPTGTVNSRLHHASRILRAELAADERRSAGARRGQLA
jgi:RNA polymerase sigma-70 factor (ECF subfamily)